MDTHCHRRLPGELSTWAVQHFMERERGGFGFMVVSILWANRLVMGSLGQPITIRRDPESKTDPLRLGSSSG